MTQIGLSEISIVSLNLQITEDKQGRDQKFLSSVKEEPSNHINVFQNKTFKYYKFSSIYIKYSVGVMFLS